MDNIDIAEQVEMLTFSALNIAKIGENAFERFPRLRYLRIDTSWIDDGMISSM